MCIVDCESYDYYCFCQDYHSCTTEHVTGDWFGEVDLGDLKQEPDDVCCVLCPIYQFTTAEIICSDSW